MIRHETHRAASSAAFVLAAVALMPGSRADNPIIQTKFTADPAPLVHDGRLYLYTSHDDDNATGFTMYNWLLYSTTDMVNWTDHGIVAGVAEPYKTFKWADGSNAWAPQVISRNGKFYLYAPFPRAGHMVIGVAVAGQPTGPFVDAVGGPLIYNQSSSNDIDPTVFIDDDGQAYLYWGHQPAVFYVKLNQDMISYSGSIVQLTRPQTYEEGPWFYRRGDNYYLAFASTCCPEGIGYAMSASPTGPWTYKGSIMDGNPASSGNHPGIVDFMGSSYLFGFNYALNAALTSTHRERRSVCVERLRYAADGTIPKLPFWSKTGAPQIGHLDPFVRTEAETIAWSQGLKTEPCSDGGMDVTAVENGDFMMVKGADFGAGAVSFEARVATAGAGGTIELRLDSQTGTRISACSVTGTGGAQSWATKTCPVSGATGVHDLYLVFVGGAGSLFNFDWWRFTPLQGSDGGADAPATGGGGRDGSAATDAGGGGAFGGAGSGGGGGAGPGAMGGGSGGSVGSGGAGGSGGAPGTTVDGATGHAAQSTGCSCDVGRSSSAPSALFALLSCVAALAHRPLARRHRRERARPYRVGSARRRI